METNSENKKRKKTRNLSVAEYFEVLQEEYLQAEFRKKIYYNPKDKAYYQRVMDYKAERITDIATRNCLTSIFNSTERLAEVRERLFLRNGKPRFAMNPVDERNYYMPGNEFSYHGAIWLLDQVDDSLSVLTIYSPSLQQYERVTKDDICRIL